MSVQELVDLSLCLTLAILREEQRLDRLRSGLEARGSRALPSPSPPGPGQRGASHGQRQEDPTEEVEAPARQPLDRPPADESVK